MFLCVTQWSDRCVLRQIFFVVVCVWALAPFVCLVCFSSWRNANLAGGFAGRPAVLCCFWFVVICLHCRTFLGPCTMMFYCLCSCKDRARVRHRPYSRKKNGRPPGRRSSQNVRNSNERLPHKQTIPRHTLTATLRTHAKECQTVLNTSP